MTKFWLLEVATAFDTLGYKINSSEEVVLNSVWIMSDFLLLVFLNMFFFFHLSLNFIAF